MYIHNILEQAPASELEQKSKEYPMRDLEYT
jgi:hypothetical protein